MEAQQEDQSAPAGDPQPVRKPYQAPSLIAWGSLRDMTRAVGVQGASDGGTNKNKRATR
jgi:hypothetical protein